MGHARITLSLAALLIVSRVSGQIWEDLNREGSRLEEQGSYREAEKVLLRAHKLATDHVGENNPGSAIILHNLAALYTKTGRYSEAEKRFKQTLIVLESELGPEDPIVALNLSNLGNLYYKLNRCEEAEPLLQRALAIMEKVYGTESDIVAIGLVNLAAIYSRLGDYSRAEPMFRRALATLETVRTANFYVATAYESLGMMYFRQGDYAQAEPCCHRALEGMEKLYGPDHPQVAEALRVYAAVLRKERRGAEAKKLEKRAELIEQRHSRENLTGLTIDAQALR
jgi:tetratricopeptide (TPR) repeat protein